MGKSFFSRYGFTILLIMMFLLSFIWMGTKRTLLSNSNNVADWLPDNFTETKEYNWFQKFFPYESFVVVSWRGCTMDDDRLEMFAQKLVPGQTIDNMLDWMDSTSHLQAELGLPADAVKKDDVSDKPEKTTSAETQTENLNSPLLREEQEPQYFKSVLTGPRLFRLFSERYGKDSATPLSQEEILQRLDGILVGPQRTAADGSPLPFSKYPTAMIITLNKPKHEKELRLVLAKIRSIGKECGVEPELLDDKRSFLVRTVETFAKTVQDMVFGIPYQINGIVMGGPPVDNVAISVEGERTLYRLAGLCAVIGLTIAMICFRSLRLTMFIFWTAILSAGLALAMVWFTGSRCDAIMLSMPALIYVLGMSGAIHLLNYYQDAVRESGLKGACERAVKAGWYPCFMANLTTAIGLGSLYLSHLIPIVKFGLYAAIGVLLSLFLLFLYLPALLYLFPNKKDILLEQQREQNHNNSNIETEDKGIIQLFWQYYGKLIIRFHTPVALVCLAAMVYLAYCMFNIQTSVKMMRFYSPNAEIIAHYTELEETLGPLVPMEVVLKFDNAECRFNTLERLRFVEEVSKALRDKLSDDVGGVMSAATMSPSTKPQGKPGSLTRRTFEYALNGRIDKYRSELKDYVTVEGDLSLEPTAPDYMNALQSLKITDSDAARLRNAGINSLKDILAKANGTNVHGITSEEMENFKQKAVQWQKGHGVDLWRISMRVWSLKKDIDYSKFIDNVKDVVNPMVDDFVAKHFPKEQFPKHPPTVENAKLSVIGKTNYWLRHKAEKIKEMFVAPPENHFEDKFPVHAVYTGMVPVVYKTQHELIEGLVDSLVGSFILIAIVMAFILKSPVAGLLAMLPNLFPIVIVFGLLGYFGVLVDVGTMMTASVAMGIAVDDTIHYLTWFRYGIDQGMTPHKAVLYAYKRCATAMCETTVIAGFGLAAFAFSTFTPTQMFGIMMLALLFVSELGDLIFLPAILSGPAGRFFVTKKNPPAPDLPEENKKYEPPKLKIHEAV